MRILTFSTPHGNYYHVHENGEIERCDMPGSISGQWRFVGIVRTGPGFAFGTGLIPFSQVIETLQSGGTFTWSYKNGPPRYTVRDYDHGTYRTWGNTKYHGILGMWLYREDT